MAAMMRVLCADLICATRFTNGCPHDVLPKVYGGTNQAGTGDGKTSVREA
jgi:hypothetical protein